MIDVKRGDRFVFLSGASNRAFLDKGSKACDFELASVLDIAFDKKIRSVVVGNLALMMTQHEVLVIPLSDSQGLRSTRRIAERVEHRARARQIQTVFVLALEESDGQATHARAFAFHTHSSKLRPGGRTEICFSYPAVDITLCGSSQLFGWL